MRSDILQLYLYLTPNMYIKKALTIIIHYSDGDALLCSIQFDVRSYWKHTYYNFFIRLLIEIWDYVECRAEYCRRRRVGLECKQGFRQTVVCVIYWKELDHNA